MARNSVTIRSLPLAVTLWREANAIHLDVTSKKAKRQLLLDEGYVLEDDDEDEELLDLPLVSLFLDERVFSYALWVAVTNYVPLTTDDIGGLLAGSRMQVRMGRKDVVDVFTEYQED